MFIKKYFIISKICALPMIFHSYYCKSMIHSTNTTHKRPTNSLDTPVISRKNNTNDKSNF